MIIIKPIFPEEKAFIESRLEISLPPNCWRDGSKIYLNIDTKPALIEFKVENGIMLVKKNNIKGVADNGDVTIQIDKIQRKTFKNLTIEEEYKLRKDYLEVLEEESIEKTKQYILDNYKHEKRVSVSGGKDSDLMWQMLQRAFKELGIKNIRDRIGYGKIPYKDIVVNNDEFIFDVFNTTNDTAQTYLQIKQVYGIGIEDIHSPEVGWYKWLEDVKNWFLPSAMVRNCCSTYKEGQLNKLLNKKKDYLLFVGMRKFESAKRSKYDWDLNEAYRKIGKKNMMPENWKRFLPIVNFKDEDVWLMLIHNDIKFNDQYRYGYSRCGCLLCPYSSDYTDLITREKYPVLIKRWDYATSKNYDIYNVATRLKWTREEWRLGKWKQGTSKEYDIISKKATPERIKQLAEIKDISEVMAEKYFKRTCKCCDKKLNPDEIAMNLKLFGRYEDIEDNREFMCKTHLCEDFNWTGKEYQEKVQEFRESGCNLF